MRDTVIVGMSSSGSWLQSSLALAMAKPGHDRLGAIGAAQLRENRGHVRLDRGLCHAELRGDAFVGQAITDKAKNARLLRRERLKTVAEIACLFGTRRAVRFIRAG